MNQDVRRNEVARREPLLELESVNTYYGESHILHDLSLDVTEGEVVSLLGRNGAGKTTTLRSIMGLNPPKSGAIRFRGEDIAGRSPDEILHEGIALVPEERIIFPDLTVEENLRVPQRRSDATREFTIEEIYDLFPILSDRQDQIGHSLSGGEQQMLTISRSLLANPNLLLMDEPSEGLAPQIVEKLRDRILQLKELELTLLLVEQNVEFAKACSNRHYIIDQGEVKFSGLLSDLDDERMKTLLGV